MAHLKNLGKVVYINISCETMLARLGDYVHRGVVLPDGYTLEDMYAERSKLYEKYADITINVSNADISDNLDAICRSLGK